MDVRDRAVYDSMVAEVTQAEGWDLLRKVIRLKAWYREWWRRANGLG